MGDASRLTTGSAPGAAAPGGSADAPIEDGWRALGESLARRRRDLGVSLAQAEETTKVRADYLRAIEAGRPGDLPGETYARGFVRLYARLLGLDGLEMMRRHGVTRPPAQADEPERPAPGVDWLPWAVVAAAVAVVAGILVLLLHG